MLNFVVRGTFTDCKLHTLALITYYPTEHFFFTKRITYDVTVSNTHLICDISGNKYEDDFSGKLRRVVWQEMSDVSAVLAVSIA
jgi:hypothetical protein